MILTPNRFGLLGYQNNYTWYSLQCKKILVSKKLTIENYSHALRDVVWSFLPRAMQRDFGCYLLGLSNTISAKYPKYLTTTLAIVFNVKNTRFKNLITESYAHTVHDGSLVFSPTRYVAWIWLLSTWLVEYHNSVYRNEFW